MAKIHIDNVAYETVDFSKKALAQLNSIQFCDSELQRLQMEAASIQVARMAYANSLKAELDKIGKGCNDPSDSAQVMQLIYMPQLAFSFQAPDVASDCCKN